MSLVFETMNRGGLGPLVAAIAAAALLWGCDDSSGDTDADTTTPPADTVIGDTTAPGDTAGPDTAVAPNACPDGTGCAGAKACRSGVCVNDPPPSSESFLADPNDNRLTTTRPDLSCVATPEQGGEAGTATLYGAVSRFGSGRRTNDIRVDVIRAADFDPTPCEAKTGDAQVVCYRGVGPVIGTALSVQPEEPSDLPSSCEGHEECPLGYECVDPNDLGGTCELQFGLYEIAGVPTNTPLIIRSYATKIESQWHDTWTFNVILWDDQVDGSDRVQYDATMVSHGQWLLTTNSVGLPEIPEDHGGVGGRIRDCRQSDRDSWPIGEVTVDLATPARGVVYFNDLEDDTVPLIDRETTNILGRFAALDIVPGWNRIAGSARIDGTVVSVGSADVYVFPNALSIVSWPGRQPFWRQQ